MGGAEVSVSASRPGEIVLAVPRVRLWSIKGLYAR